MTSTTHIQDQFDAMKRILAVLAAGSFGVAFAVWIILINFPTAMLAGLPDPFAFAIFGATVVAALASTAVLLLAERSGLRFFGALGAIASVLALAAFYSTLTHQPRSPRRHADRIVQSVLAN